MHHFSTAYLAPVSYYAQLYAATEGACIEQWEHYVKQTYRNRCIIATAQGPLPLTIPTESNGGEKCLMRDVRISDHGNWRHLHWNALEAAYRQSPFFEYYADDFRPFYERKITFLLDFNERLRELVCNLIGFEPRVGLSTEYLHEVPAGDTDLRTLIHPKRPCTEALPGYAPRPYYQVFKERHGFLPDLSIVDLLFNMGPESLLVIAASTSDAVL
ncbi:MAG: WbqC family protein [Bacteroidaceae bacterium]|nr:WbqC family protein [Bacteroidaceae bacterium]